MQQKARLVFAVLWKAQTSGSPGQGAHCGLWLHFPCGPLPPKQKYSCLWGLAEEKGLSKDAVGGGTHNTPPWPVLQPSTALKPELGGEHGAAASLALPVCSALTDYKPGRKNPC